MDKHLGRRALIADLTDENVAALMSWRLSLGRAPGTVNSLRDQLIALGSFAVQKGVLDCAPDVAELREYTRTPTAWFPDEIDRLFASARQEVGHIFDIPSSDWWVALLFVIWDCGGRIGAILLAKPGQVDLSRGTIRLDAEDQKQDDDQEFEIHEETIAALKAINFESRKKIFPYNKSEGRIYSDLRRILKRAGLPSGRRDLFHKLRRSVASWYEAAGGDATKLLGHSCRKVTLRYLDPRVVGPKQAAKVLRRPNSDPPPG
jgi:integrase